MKSWILQKKIIELEGGAETGATPKRVRTTAEMSDSDCSLSVTESRAREKRRMQHDTQTPGP